MLTNRVASGMNDGSADNLSFVLTPKPDPPLRISAFGHTNNAWRVEFLALSNRVYGLERSVNLKAWSGVVSNLSNHTAPMALTDTNPPSGHAFYRVSSRRP